MSSGRAHSGSAFRWLLPDPHPQWGWPSDMVPDRCPLREMPSLWLQGRGGGTSQAATKPRPSVACRMRGSGPGQPLRIKWPKEVSLGGGGGVSWWFTEGVREGMSLRHLFCVSRKPNSVVLSRQSSHPNLRFSGILCPVSPLALLSTLRCPAGIWVTWLLSAAS